MCNTRTDHFVALLFSQKHSIFLVLDNSELGEEMGEGGEAQVYKGSWFHADVAIKVFAGKYHRHFATEGECAVLRQHCGQPKF